MLSQIFLLPFVIGISEYGKSMITLAPAFIAQASIEPYIQSIVNTSEKKEKTGFEPWFVIKALLIATAITFSLQMMHDLSIDRLLRLEVIALSAVYLIWTLFQATGSYYRDFKSLAAAGCISVLTYVTCLLFLDLEGAQLALSSLACAFASSIIVMFSTGIKIITTKAGMNDKELSFFKKSAASLFRAPLVAVTNGSVLALGSLGISHSDIGLARIMLSVGNAARYFNTTPLQVLQSNISKTHSIEKMLAEIRSYAKELLLYSFVVAIVGIVATSNPVSTMILAERMIMQEIDYKYILLSSLFSSIALVQPLSYVVFLIAGERWWAGMLYLGTAISSLATCLLICFFTGNALLSLLSQLFFLLFILLFLAYYLFHRNS